jgi:hypothetical protein
MRGSSRTSTAVNFSVALVFLLALLNGCTNSSDEAFQKLMAQQKELMAQQKELMAQQKAHEAAAREAALQEINSDKIMAPAFRAGICDSIFLCWHVKCRTIFKSLVIGMSEPDVLQLLSDLDASPLSPPQPGGCHSCVGDIHTTQVGTHVHEQWVWYDNSGYVYFDNGKLTTLQD